MTDMPIQEIQDAREYELALLGLTEETTEEVRKAISKHKGEITLDASPKKILLAYPIKKETGAFFSFFHIRIQPSELPALDHDLKTDAHVLRFLFVNTPYIKPRSAVSRPRPSSPPMRAPEPPSPLPLSNEALEKKIEEILQ